MLRTMATGIDICVTVTLLRGLVLARSVFHHSMNYASAVVFGRADPVVDPDRKLEAMRILTERVVPGRWADARGPNDKEFRGTLVLELPLTEASAKLRSGPPGDDEEDYELDVWAGVVPVELRFGTPVADPRLSPGITVPTYLDPYARP
jgi:nitroimidazol reductase NimA-like FMN-containing flavoprotein (pyridoxamine 5'-phosphate oxidase superfamily)